MLAALNEIEPLGVAESVTCWGTVIDPSGLKISSAPKPFSSSSSGERTTDAIRPSGKAAGASPTSEKAGVETPVGLFENTTAGGVGEVLM